MDADEGGREGYEVTSWVDSIMCGERERERELVGPEEKPSQWTSPKESGKD